MNPATLRGTDTPDIGRMGYAPLSTCILFVYAGVVALVSVLYIFGVIFFKESLREWLNYSGPLVEMTGRFLPAVDNLTARITLIGKYVSEIPVVTNVIAVNWLLWMPFAAILTITVPLEIWREVRSHGPRLRQKLDIALRGYKPDTLIRNRGYQNFLKRKSMISAFFFVCAIVMYSGGVFSPLLPLGLPNWIMLCAIMFISLEGYYFLILALLVVYSSGLRGPDKKQLHLDGEDQ